MQSNGTVSYNLTDTPASSKAPEFENLAINLSRPLFPTILSTKSLVFEQSPSTLATSYRDC